MDENRFEGMARKVGGKVEGALGDMAGDSKLKVDGAMDNLAGSAQRAYGQAKDAVRDMTGKMGDQAGDYGAQVMDQLEDAGDYIAEQVDQRPITAILVAAGIGFLLALATKPAPKVIYHRR